MQLNPYLCFEGRCGEAIEFYKQAVGAEVVFSMPFSEVPQAAQNEQQGCGANMKPDSICHAEVKIAGATIFMSDGMCSGHAEFKGITLSLSVENDEQVKERFAALSEGGTVHMAPHQTFFASLWGVCADKFGVGWMVRSPAPVPAEY
jgi:PhnB protein